MNDYLEIVLYVLAGIGAVYLFSRLLGILFRVWLMYKIKSVLGEGSDLMEELKKRIIVLDVELDNNTYFCYNSEDKQFVCQGQSYTDIRDAVRKIDPEKRIALSEKTPKEILERLRAEYEEVTKQESLTEIVGK